MAALELLLKDAPHKMVKKPFDFWGFGFLSVFLVFALLAMSKGQREGWTSAFIIACFTIAAVGFLGFLLVDLYVDYPIIDIKLYRIPVFASTSTITVARSAGLFGSIFLIPIFVQQQLGYSALQSGLLMLPSSLVMCVIFPIVGVMADRVGPRMPSLAGLLIVAYSLFLYNTLDINTSIWGLVYPTMIRGVGMGLLMAPLTTAFMNSVPQHKIGVASSMNNILQQIGASMGIAFFTAVLTSRSVYHIAMTGQAVRSGNPVFLQSMINLTHHVHGLGYGYRAAMAASRALLVGSVIKHAVVQAFQDTFFIAALVVMIAVPLAFLLPMNVIRQPHVFRPEQEKIKEEKFDIVID